jgi:DNA repair protein RadD
MRELRQHQSDALSLLRQSLGKGNRKVMVQAPTGFGKTVLASHIVSGALAKGNRVCFVVPALSLIDQTVQSLYEDGIRNVGVIQADHPMTNPSMPVQVASIQTIARRNYNRMKFNIVVVDEAHVLYKAMIQWMADWNAIPFIGLTATPWTRGLGKHYEDLVVAATTQDLINSGYLSNFRVFAPSHPDLSGVRTIAGDYHEGELSQAMQAGALVADIVTTWKAKADNRPTLAFGVDRAHAKSIQAHFQGAGITCGYIDAYTPLDERQEIANAFHAGQLQVVSNVGCLTTGIDWDVRCIILARPTKSEILFTQIIGRGLRTADGKDDCLILDHSDTHLRLGFVTDITHKELCTGKPAESNTREVKEALPKECPSCAYLKAPKVHKCPSCGFAPERGTDVETVAGSLEELEKGKAKLNRKATAGEKAAFYGGLSTYARGKGYKSGWVSNQYREKYGVWPNAFRDSPLVEPNTEVMGWIHHQRIKFAKGRKAA